MTTYVRMLSQPASTTPVGSAWTFVVETVDENGFVTDLVTPVFTVTRPDASTATPAPFVPTAGMYAFSYTLDMSGRYTCHVATPEDALDMAVYALGPVTAAGMPNVNDVASYLRERVGGWSTAQLSDALEAERAAQRAKCGERPSYPADLREALFRRVSRNLAMRQLPLAVATGDADSGPTILPGNDPEVRRLEAPWRKLVMG